MRLVFTSTISSCIAPGDRIQKVIAMITDVEKKAMDEGVVAQKEYEKYAEWCEDTSRNLQYLGHPMVS